MALSILVAVSNRIRKGLPPPLPGQILFDQPGTFTWICPANVHEVCVALVGAGGCGSIRNNFTGDGANVRYINNIPVVPGQAYQLMVPPTNWNTKAAINTTSAFGFTAASPLSAVVKGGDGTQGLSSNYSQMDSGGNVGLVGADRNSFGIDLKTFQLTGATGTFSRDGGDFGGGGGIWRDKGSSGEGGRAGIRIIWGDDRAFPSTNIMDMIQ